MTAIANAKQRRALLEKVLARPDVWIEDRRGRRVDWQDFKLKDPETAAKLGLNDLKARNRVYVMMREICGAKGISYAGGAKTKKRMEAASASPAVGNGAVKAEPQIRHPEFCPGCGLNLQAFTLAFNVALRRSNLK